MKYLLEPEELVKRPLLMQFLETPWEVSDDALPDLLDMTGFNACITPEINVNISNLVVFLCFMGCPATLHVLNTRANQYVQEIIRYNIVFELAAYNGHLQVIRYLRKQALTTMQQVILTNDCNLFQLAAHNGHLEVMRYLIKRTPELKQHMVGSCNYLAFKIAAAQGRIGVLQYLMEQSPPETVQQMIQSNCDLAIRWAAENNHLNTVTYLIELIDLKGLIAEHLNTVMNACCALNNDALIDQLLKKMPLNVCLTIKDSSAPIVKQALIRYGIPSGMTFAGNEEVVTCAFFKRIQSHYNLLISGLLDEVNASILHLLPLEVFDYIICIMAALEHQSLQLKPGVISQRLGSLQRFFAPPSTSTAPSIKEAVECDTNPSV